MHTRVTTGRSFYSHTPQEISRNKTECCRFCTTSQRENWSHRGNAGTEKPHALEQISLGGTNEKQSENAWFGAVHAADVPACRNRAGSETGLSTGTGAERTICRSDSGGYHSSCQLEFCPALGQERTRSFHNRDGHAGRAVGQGRNAT